MYVRWKYMSNLIDSFENNLFPKFLSEGRLVSVYHDKDSPHLFDCGVIFAIDGSYIALASVSRCGVANGIRIIKRETIYRLEFDSPYNKELEQVMHESNSKLQTFQVENHRVLESALSFCKSDYLIEIVLMDGEYCIQGVIHDVNEDYCVIQETSDRGDAEGLNYLSLSAIFYVSIYTEIEEAKLES